MRYVRITSNCKLCMQFLTWNVKIEISPTRRILRNPFTLILSRISLVVLYEIKKY